MNRALRDMAACGSEAEARVQDDTTRRRGGCDRSLPAVAAASRLLRERLQPLALAPSPAKAGEGWGGVPSGSSEPWAPPPSLPLPSQGEGQERYFEETYFSRRIRGTGRPCSLSASKQASTMFGLPHR